MAVIEVHELVKSYGGRRVVDGVSFSVEEGEIFGILGPNGAGKTTTVESIAGLRRPDSGTVRVLDHVPTEDVAFIRQRLGIQLQESSLPDRIKVWEALDLYSSFYPSPVPWPDLLERLGLSEVRDSRYANLSGGEKQRLSIALSLVGKPQVAILDELTTGLDPQARRDTWSLIEQLRDRGVTVVLVTHFMEEAERLADRVALIDSGKLIALDSPAGLVKSTRDEQIIRFRLSSPIEEGELVALPEVTAVSRMGDELVITGSRNVLFAVASFLVQAGVVAEELRLDRATLDDAFLALTGHSLHSESD